MNLTIKKIYIIAIISTFVSLNAGESVIDLQHHLQWQDSQEKNEDIWKMAVGYCKQLNLDSKNDWRLATSDELKLLGKSQTLKKKFKYFENHIYWSIEEDKEDNLNAVTVYTGNGFVSVSDKCEKNFMLCVRDLKK